MIPLFIRAMLDGEAPVIFGDGKQTRDFTYVADVVTAGLAALERDEAVGAVINVACGTDWDINYLAEVLGGIVGGAREPRHEPPRPGDVRHSRADIDRARRLLRFEPTVGFEEGLRRTVDWFRRCARERARGGVSAHPRPGGRGGG